MILDIVFCCWPIGFLDKNVEMMKFGEDLKGEKVLKKLDYMDDFGLSEREDRVVMMLLLVIRKSSGSAFYL